MRRFAVGGLAGSGGCHGVATSDAKHGGTEGDTLRRLVQVGGRGGTIWDGCRWLLAGALIGGHVLGDITVGDVIGYWWHRKESDPADVGTRLALVISDGRLVVAYGLILLGCGLLFRCW